MSNSLLSLFKKEQHDWFDRDSSKLLSITRNSNVYDSFSLLFPFLCPRANRSRHSPLSHYFLKNKGSDSLSLLFTKEQPWADRSRCSSHKSNSERFAYGANDKRVTEVIHSFLQVNRSFAFTLTKTSDLLEIPMREMPTLDFMKISVQGRWRTSRNLKFNNILFYFCIYSVKSRLFLNKKMSVVLLVHCFRGWDQASHYRQGFA